MVERGYTDRRSGKSGPGMGALSDATGLHTSTISRAIFGRGSTDQKTVNLLVEKLGDDVAEWLGVQYHGPWEPPAAASALNPRQRKALEELIVSMTEGGEVHELRTAANKKPDTGPANQPVKIAARHVGRKGSNQE